MTSSNKQNLIQLSEELLTSDVELTGIDGTVLTLSGASDSPFEGGFYRSQLKVTPSDQTPESISSQAELLDSIDCLTLGQVAAGGVFHGRVLVEDDNHFSELVMPVESVSIL